MAFALPISVFHNFVCEKFWATANVGKQSMKREAIEGWQMRTVRLAAWTAISLAGCAAFGQQSSVDLQSTSVRTTNSDRLRLPPQPPSSRTYNPTNDILRGFIQARGSRTHTSNYPPVIKFDTGTGQDWTKKVTDAKATYRVGIDSSSNTWDLFDSVAPGGLQSKVLATASSGGPVTSLNLGAGLLTGAQP